MRYSPVAKQVIKDAMLSPGYRKFRRMFKTKCTKCGSNYCAVTLGAAKRKWFKVRYDKVPFGFTCLNCGKTWIHAYNLGLLRKKSLEALKDVDHTYIKGGEINGYRRLGKTSKRT